MASAVAQKEREQEGIPSTVNGDASSGTNSYHKMATTSIPQINGSTEPLHTQHNSTLREDADGQISPGAVSPGEFSPTYLTPLSTTDRSQYIQGALSPGGLHPNTAFSSSHSPNRVVTNEINGSDVPPEDLPSPALGKKIVQFQKNTSDVDQTDEDRDTSPLPQDRGESSRTMSIATKLKELARWQTFTHARSTSAASNPRRSIDGREMNGHSPLDADHLETGVSATLDEADSDAHADASADESAAEGFRSLAMQKKRKRKARRFEEIDTAPTSPHSPMVGGLHSAPGEPPRDRPHTLLRSATDTDVTAHRDGQSEDEGRRGTVQTPTWTRRHPLRGLSYGGARRIVEEGGESSAPRRPLTLLTMSHSSSAKDQSPADTPKTSRRKLLTERSATATAMRWKQVTNRLRLIGQNKKKERTQDQQKSAELLAELTAGSPAALMLASMFQRDEHNNRRIPVLLEQLKVRVTDSEVDKSREPDNPTPGDRHMIFRIELEYGSGINRMRWVVKRSLRDFANLHIKYKLHYSSEKLKGRGDSSKQLPKFPRSAFPYPKAFSGLDDEGDEEDEGATENEAGVTDGEQSRTRNQPSLALNRRKSSIGGNADGSAVANGSFPRPDARAKEKQRKKLETYLQAMLKFMLFRADSNRLCKFLEISALGVRLAAEGSYHGKEGFLLIRSAKGLDFRKALTPGNLKNRHTPKWFLVRHSYVVCVDSPEEMHIYDVFLFDSDFQIQSLKQRSQTSAREIAEAAQEAARHPQHHRLKLSNSERKLKLLARNDRQLLQFEESIRLMVEASPWAKTNRFDSFAPIRPNCFAQWLVDGRDHMWVVSRALNQAKDVIYIHDWWLSPEIYMRRPPAISQKWRLDRLLKRKAEEGVKIFVIVYRNIESAVPIDSSYTKFSLLDLHPNVFVQRSPNQFRQNTFFWAHHEKLVIVDHTIAFVGGIDLCFGRWDTPQHPLIDDKPTGFERGDEPRDADHCQLWPGKDYSNPRIQDFYALNKPYEEMYDRQRIARMPWHDISMQVVGQPARDLTRHFVQRWNYILRQRKPTRPTPFLLPPPDFNAADLEALGLDGTCEVQILRSAGPWSLGTPEKTEHSIMNAYTKMIEESEHFVYIENQFFISSCITEGATVHNKIGDALVERIARAARNDESWRAVIIIPLIPGFQNTVEQEGGTSVRLIMQYQYRSICRGDSSIFGRLRTLGIEPEDYIQFYALRQWGKIGPRQALCTEQLYIHAKCMVVDDRVAIIGSANINERSMLGNRDSECAAIVRDTDTLWSRMNGEPYQVGRFPHSLRMRLMREHLGLDVDKIMEEAQVMEADRRKMESTDGNAGQSPTSPETTKSTPLAAKLADRREIDKRATEIRTELLSRAEDLSSFNHDVDWEQAGNPNLKANRKLTEDHRVTGTDWHKNDLEGRGADNMAQLDREGLTAARDTVLVKGAREVLISKSEPEGRNTVQDPRQLADSLRIPSYVRKMEAPEPPMPPKPTMARMNTEALGLPMLSQLPPIPLVDDTDIGGPPVDGAPGPGAIHSHHPLIGELRRPMVDRDCMTDPIHDAFMDDIWHLIAENNTKIYRTVFRCMPDNQVRDWNDYHQYLAYEQRFEQLQGHDPIMDEKVLSSVKSAPDRSGPPGSGSKTPAVAIKNISQVPSDLAHKAAEMKEKSEGQNVDSETGQTVEDDKDHLRKWAAEANQAQEERQHKVLRRTESQLDEKTGLSTVPEESQVMSGAVRDRKSEDSSTQHPTSSPPTSAGLDRERTPTSSHSATISDPPQQPINTTTSSGQVKRRRRGTTRSSRKEFNAADDLMSIDEAEELLGCVQGHLVSWPYDWLDKVEAGGNWLFPFDQISPIEIYI